ncbi:MAG: hypothetical protein ACR2FO_07450 [Actinomycetota bacterium]
MNNVFHTLVESADLDSLLREVDALCERRDYDGLFMLTRMCRLAVERGKQLWPIAEHITYRLVLEGPPEVAGPLVQPGAGRFAPGPLAEVAASTHTFAELAEHLPSAQTREHVAAERVLRGEDLSGDPRAHPPVVEVPLRLLDFEPPYRVATYLKDHVETQEPSTSFGPAVAIAGPGEVVDDDDLEAALMDLVRPWFEESAGHARAVVIEGDALQAIGSLGWDEAAVREIKFAEALELMGWAAASGGMHGRRRGAAFGRFAAWWAAAEICGMAWPPEPDQLEAEGSKLDWLAFERPTADQSGWRLGLACSSPPEGWAWALHAQDVLEDV